jgi:2-oxoglutarate dehydrogenase E1 component
MVVCNFTSPANYFHALRQQVSREMKKPLVVMSPKSLLRHPGCISSPEDLTERGYLPIIGPAVSNAKRLVLCTGKVYFDLAKGLEDQSDLQETVGIVRIEQLYPLRKDDLVALFKAHPGTSVVWAQEEPANMGAWSHLRYQIDEAMDEAGLSGRVAYAGRPASASPATGMAAIHQLEQALVVEKALRG